MVDFIFVIIELFHYLYQLRHYKQKSVEVSISQRGWVTFSADFRGKGRRPPTTLGVRAAEWLPFLVVSKYLHCTI